MLCWLPLGPYSPVNSRAERSEIGPARGIQGPTQPQLLHRATISAKQERADPFIHIAPSHETDRQFIRNHTLLEIIWDRNKMCGAWKGKTPTIFVQTEQSLPGVNHGSHPLNYTGSPL